MDPDKIHEIYEQGYYAGHYGAGMDTCPYEARSAEIAEYRRLWMRGYNVGHFHFLMDSGVLDNV
jgi:ribosome modulation factor